MLEPREFVESGIYKNEEEVIQEGIRHLLQKHPEYRVKIAVEKYRRGEISLGKAARLAGVHMEEMKEILRDEKVSISLGPGELDELKLDIETARKAIK